jgi:2-desacetyl-2-hydroxyethyl bacteriochlorophyllide A dehydrogenase
MKIKTIVFTEPNHAEIQENELAPCAENEVVAETIYSFVSPGTELRVFAGKQQNSRFPLIPGYSWVGRIIEVGKNVKGWKGGELVSGRNAIPLKGIISTWGGQASHHRCDPGSSIVKLRENVDPWKYVHAEVASISYRGVCSAFPAKGETAVVIGQGLIGAFNVKWLLLHGARVIAVDIENFRLELAQQWGATATLNATENNIREQILSYCEDGADIVIEASGSAAGARLAESLLRKPLNQRVKSRYRMENMSMNAALWPRLVYQASNYPDMSLKPYGLHDHDGEGAIILTPSDRSVSDRQAVVDYIDRGKLPIHDIIDAPTPLELVQQAYINLRDNPDKVRGICFKWN